MKPSELFARKRDDGNYDILCNEDGYPATTIDTDVPVYSWNSDFSVKYEHTGGIVLTAADVATLGIETE